MKYSRDSYFDVSEEQFGLFFKVIDELALELQEGNTRGRSYNDFIKAGVEKETMSILKAGKFITWKDKKSNAWISWENEYYDDRTVYHLRSDIKNYLGYEV